MNNTFMSWYSIRLVANFMHVVNLCYLMKIFMILTVDWFSID